MNIVRGVVLDMRAVLSKGSTCSIITCVGSSRRYLLVGVQPQESGRLTACICEEYYGRGYVRTINM